MEINYKDLIQDVLNLNVVHASIIDVSEIKFSEDLRQMCAKNSCGKYNTNWMCPPAVGELEELKAKIKKYKQGLVLQTVCKLRNSFDFEGMMEAKSIHEDVLREVIDLVKVKYNLKDIFPLGAGACDICSKCAYMSGEKCRFPEKAVVSIEACGIDVLSLVKSCGIPYNNGKDTVSYVGFILF